MIFRLLNIQNLNKKTRYKYFSYDLERRKLVINITTKHLTVENKTVENSISKVFYILFFCVRRFLTKLVCKFSKHSKCQ